MESILTCAFGAGFGALRDRVSVLDPNYLENLPNLTILHLTKTILLAIGTGSVLMFAGQMVGFVDMGHISVNTVYVGVFVGGVLLGIGWAFVG